MVRWQCFCKPLPNKCYSLPWQERARSQAQLSPSQVPVLAERRQSSAGSFLRARSPDPAQQGHPRGRQAPNPTSPRAPQASHRVGAVPTDFDPGRQPQPLRSQRQEWERVHCCLKAWSWPMDGPGKYSGALQDTTPSLFAGRPLSHQLTRWPKAGQAGGSQGEGRDLPLTWFSTWGPQHHQRLTESPL